MRDTLRKCVACWWIAAAKAHQPLRRDNPFLSDRRGRGLQVD
jgi:hypothetical protein